ncbi:isocitrate lyase/phosphoenolpyruvate mutase family protein [Leifsonia bigeumensis]|uniref:Isocitrate lyase/phosphoenolpyruvate mutase family protein n=1 Tax=Leifsonella bigeumensis TaxID=433643 RepID=A0ABP7F3K0_9MICO
MVNVWDAVTARTVAAVPGVTALATASHAISFAHGVPDGEGLSVDQALAAASIVIDAVELPVSVDFERGYSPDAAGVAANVRRLIAAGAAGLNLEDSYGSGPGELFEIEDAAARVAAARAAGDQAGIPIVINARVDALARGADLDEAILRGNRYLAAGADVIFVLGLGTEELVAHAVDELEGRLSVIAGPASVPLKRLAELGVSRVSFGPRSLGLTLSHLQATTATLTARGDYPPELGFSY